MHCNQTLLTYCQVKTKGKGERRWVRLGEGEGEGQEALQVDEVDPAAPQTTDGG